MHRSLRSAATAGTVLLLAMALTACVQENSPVDPAPTVPAGASSTPETSVAPEPADQTVVISVDGIAVNGGPLVPFDKRELVIDALADAMSVAPEEEPLEGPYGGEYTAYVWDGLRATDDDSRIVVSVTADAPSVSFTTPEGVGLGASRAEALSAGAEDEWDEDGDGIADYLKIGMREVSGTRSLVHPGQVGVEYVLLVLTEDVVTGIQSGANDYSDI
ncbi:MULTISPECIES: hypothetical protein [unclassified Microbacterium]|uniref:hypothetical protein n=2 Tax=Microbacterium TaxID=33882 RepID=UPI0024684639|nr:MULTISPECIES: hypothetical protein [unclassified Microbacterium]MDH5132968.1 hypothetical protein [Microbacterium sp. RD10]MDH5136090.1 hypothetical protein [Microbacterium sp. RD11]MDH5145924.1 hypothetical protein [Microbacterium sp. RD12]MDH5154494.1 hypothetical protein [Microbacterium sp. RD06]